MVRPKSTFLNYEHQYLKFCIIFLNLGRTLMDLYLWSEEVGTDEQIMHYSPLKTIALFSSHWAIVPTRSLLSLPNITCPMVRLWFSLWCRGQWIILSRVVFTSISPFFRIGVTKIKIKIKSLVRNRAVSTWIYCGCKGSPPEIYQESTFHYNNYNFNNNITRKDNTDSSLSLASYLGPRNWSGTSTAANH